MGRDYHTAWTPTSLPDSIVLLGGESSEASLTAETVSGVKLEDKNILLLQHIYTGGIKVAGGSFDLKHSGWGACGIPEAGDTMVLTGGVNHNYVTRWVDGKIIIIIIIIM